PRRADHADRVARQVVGQQRGRASPARGQEAAAAARSAQGRSLICLANTTMRWDALYSGWHALSTRRFSPGTLRVIQMASGVTILTRSTEYVKVPYGMASTICWPRFS